MSAVKAGKDSYVRKLRDIAALCALFLNFADLPIWTLNNKTNPQIDAKI